VVSNSRSVTGPKGMTEAQVADWDELLRQMIESDEWKQELEANYWSSEYMGSAETRKAMERDNVALRAFPTDLGLAGQTKTS
jgi:tripartite-type tricarboxylate transporter receptor subunit TctC